MGTPAWERSAFHARLCSKAGPRRRRARKTSANLVVDVRAVVVATEAETADAVGIVTGAAGTVAAVEIEAREGRKLDR